LSVRKDLQLLLALPWPNPELRRDLPEVLRNDLLPGLESERLQLVFPWLKTRDAVSLPAGCEPADGSLAGLLASGSLIQGPYRSVAGRPMQSIYDTAPRLPQSIQELEGSIERICWFGQHPRGWQLFSDVTTRSDSALRHAAVRRLLILLVRVARQEGWARVFEPNGPATWRTVERNLSRLLARIYADNGLAGRSADDAFTVQCDRSLMTRQDLDNGRLIGVIQVQPAVPLNQIVVALSLNELGQVEANEVAA
jgi:phage tail sheath protein FI